jgi:hypothetical protein
MSSMKTLLKTLAAALALAAAAPAVAADRPEEARIHFVDHGGIRDWRIVDRDTLLIRGQRNQWYKAELFAPAWGLNFAHSIGFDTGFGGTFDRFSSVIVEGRRYPLRSLVRVDVPPPRRG